MTSIQKNLLQSEVNQAIEILQNLIIQKNFCLNDDFLLELEKRLNDDRVTGWIFAYQVYQAKIPQRKALLKANLNHPNPRVREQVCDIIGDEGIEDLRNDLKKLFEDSVDYVAQAARYNAEEMF